MRNFSSSSCSSSAPPFESSDTGPWPPSTELPYILDLCFKVSDLQSHKIKVKFHYWCRLMCETSESGASNTFRCFQTSKFENLCIWDPHMQVNLTLFLGQFWQNFRNWTSYVRKFWIKGILIWETLHLNVSGIKWLFYNFYK
jgi:hypothetical protein